MNICDKCGAKIKNQENYRRHVKTCNGEGTQADKAPGPQTCEHCGKEFKNRANYTRHVVYCKRIKDVDLQFEYDSGLSLKQIEDKYNVSKKFLHGIGLKTRKKEESTAIRRRDNPENFFFGGTRRKSKGEMVFKEMLESSGLAEKYNIEEQYHLFGYRLDFAFPDLKLDVEIDGMQHYTKQEVKDKDKIRESTLVDAEWKIYRIASKDFLGRPNVVFNLFENYLKKKKKCFIVRYSGQVVDGDKRWSKDREKKITKSDIDFSLTGWSIKTGELLGISSSSALRWIQKNMPKFYKEKCRTPRKDYNERM